MNTYNFSVTGLPEGATVDITKQKRGDVDVYTLDLRSNGGTISFAGTRIEIDANASEAVGEWFPEYRHYTRGVCQTWNNKKQSAYMFAAPVYSYYRADDSNVLTAAIDDSVLTWDINAGIEEPLRMLRFAATINSLKAESKQLHVFVDCSRRPYYESLEDVADWWAEQRGGVQDIPECAYDPVYSSWYAFQRNVKADTLLEQCRMAAELGCKTVFIDDGWATPLDTVSYRDTGDWKPHPDRFPDIKGFVDEIHKLGMKAVLWIAPGLSGFNARSSKLYDGMFIGRSEDCMNNVLDPRYTFVRSGLIRDTCNIVHEYNFDGLKIDFVDSIRGADCEPDSERDYASLTDALRDMLTVIYDNLKAEKPDVLVEYRQCYVGPDILLTANIIRSGDCAQDFLTNRINVIDLRLNTKVAVHSDMIQLIENEAPESSALQLTNIMFSTPQISVRFDKISAEQTRMLKFWIGFMSEKRELLQKSSFEPKHCYSNYSSVTVRNSDERLTTLYGENLLILDEAAPRVYVVNAYERAPVYLGSACDCEYTYRLIDCMGDEVGSGKLSLSGAPKAIDVPFNGMLVMDKVK